MPLYVAAESGTLAIRLPCRSYQASVRAARTELVR